MDIGSDNPTTTALVRALLSPAPRPLAQLDGELLLFEGQYLLHYKCDSGEEHWKALTGAALRAAFAGQPVDSGWLPPGVVRVGEGPQGPFAVAWQPPAVHELLLQLPGSGGAEEEHGPSIPRALADQVLAIPLPGLVMLGVGTQHWVWTVQGDRFDPAAPAFHTPLPNVYPDGKVCWGANSAPLATPDGIRAALKLFLVSPFGGALVGNKCRSYPNEVRLYLLQLAGRSAGWSPAELAAQEWGWGDGELRPHTRYESGGSPLTVEALVAAALGLGESP